MAFQNKPAKIYHMAIPKHIIYKLLYQNSTKLLSERLAPVS